MLMISLIPTECSSSPTVPQTTFMCSCPSNSSYNSLSDITYGSGGTTRVLRSMSKSTLPFNSILVPSASCMISAEITSGSTRPNFLPSSTAAASATLLFAGSIIVSMITLSPHHSTSGVSHSPVLYLATFSSLLFTLSSSSSSSM